MRTSFSGASLATLLLTAGCGPKTSPPRGFLPDVDEAISDVYGAWIRVQVDEHRDFEGELIAAQGDSLHALVADGDLESVRIADAARVTVEVHTTVASSYAAWTVFGTLSTPSHGAYAVLTAPMWLLAGVGVSAAVADQGSHDWWVERGEAVDLRPFARFPAGLPEGLDPALLRTKPPIEPPPDDGP
ncbi:MAG: hypothetical protein ACRDGR_08435 [bacterium]